VEQERNRWLHRLFTEYRRDVFRVAAAILNDREEAMDVVQDTFIQAMKQEKRIRGDARIRGWLLTVARNLSIDRFRRRRRQEPESEPESWMSGETGMGRELSMDMKAIIREVFPTLPRRQQEVFALRYYEDLGFAEIAAAMGVSEGTVKTLHHRAIETMRAAALRKWRQP